MGQGGEEVLRCPRLSGCHRGDISTRRVGDRERGRRVLQTMGWCLCATQQMDCHLAGGTQSIWRLVVVTGVKLGGEMSGMDMAPQPPGPGLGHSQGAGKAPCSCIWFWFPLRHPRVHPADQNSGQGMRNKPGGQACPDGMNSADCKLLTAFEFRARSLLDSSSERRLGLLKAIYKRQSTI